MDFDQKYIKISLFLLRQILGKTFPNPPVVAIVVESDKSKKDHKIINFGVTAYKGRPHAEAEAIKNVKFLKNKVYTLYSTLEPCCHQGRGRPCTDFILRSKISRVVFSLLDPDPRVNGGGMRILKNNGLIVNHGIMKNEMYEIYQGYFLNKLCQRPQIILKLATSLDGKISSKLNTFSKITNSTSQKYLHILRSEVDAVLVGSNTVRVDNCLLTCRAKGLEKFSPIRVILNKNLDIKKNFKIFKDCEKTRTIIFSKNIKNNKIKLFLKKNVEVVSVDQKNYNLNYLVKFLSKLGVCKLLVEGGGKVFSSFLKSGLVDLVYIFRANFFIGSKGKDAISSSQIKKSKKNKYNLKIFTTFDNDQLEILGNYNNKKIF